LFGHEEAATWARGLTGRQEKAGSCPNKMLALYKEDLLSFIFFMTVIKINMLSNVQFFIFFVEI
jgi:hypothetical protein